MPNPESVAVNRKFEQYRESRDRRVREQLILDHRWIAERCAARFARRGEQFDDLLQVALLGLVKAVDRFDPGRGTTFPGYAMPTVTGELRRHFRDHTWSMSVSRRSKDLLTAMNAAIEALNHRNGRAPTVVEVARELNVDHETVLETLEARAAYHPRSLYRPDQPAEHAQDSECRLGEEDEALVEAPMRVSVLSATRRLDPRSRRIVLWRFYEGCTQREIGERLGIGQVQVSRLLRAALGQIRAEFGEV